MILLSPTQRAGSVHIQSCKVFESIKDMVEYLESITSKWDNFSVCPIAYELSTASGIKLFSDEWHRQYVYPYTYNSRMKVIHD